MATTTAKRTTIYVGTVHKERLLQWTQEYVGADSTSEAIFAALERFKNSVVDERKKARLKILQGVRGAWAKDEQIEQAFREMRESWPTPGIEEES